MSSCLIYVCVVDSSVVRFYTSYLFLDTLYVLPCIPPGISPTLWTSLPCPASILNKSFSLSTPLHLYYHSIDFLTFYVPQTLSAWSAVSWRLSFPHLSWQFPFVFLPFFTSSTWHRWLDTHTLSLSHYSVNTSHTILFRLYTFSSFVLLHTWFVPYLILVLYLLVLLSCYITYVLYFIW